MGLASRETLIGPNIATPRYCRGRRPFAMSWWILSGKRGLRAWQTFKVNGPLIYSLDGTTYVGLDLPRTVLVSVLPGL